MSSQGRTAGLALTASGDLGGPQASCVLSKRARLRQQQRTNREQQQGAMARDSKAPRGRRTAPGRRQHWRGGRQRAEGTPRVADCLGVGSRMQRTRSSRRPRGQQGRSAKGISNARGGRQMLRCSRWRLAGRPRRCSGRRTTRPGTSRCCRSTARTWSACASPSLTGVAFPCRGTSNCKFCKACQMQEVCLDCGVLPDILIRHGLSVCILHIKVVLMSLLWRTSAMRQSVACKLHDIVQAGQYRHHAILYSSC